MKPLHHFSNDERTLLESGLAEIRSNPYREFGHFIREVRELALSSQIQDTLRDLCEVIRQDRVSGKSDAHVLRNCPIDKNLPLLDLDDPLQDKYLRKKTHISESFLALFSVLTQAPLLAYSSRHGGDFFTDVIAINRYEGKASGFTSGDLVYHNDRTSHPVRADYITLLGMHCPGHDLVYTLYVDGKELLQRIPSELQSVLRQPYFVTPYDAYSKDLNGRQVTSEPHSILQNDHCFVYRDTATTYLPGAPVQALDALLALKDALATAPKVRHRIIEGDLFTLANQLGLHNRERVEISDPELARHRWLQKTYAFRNQEACDAHAARWHNGIAGLVND